MTYAQLTLNLSEPEKESFCLDTKQGKHETLHREILLLVREERVITSKIIEALQKVADQKLFLKMGYPTLFSYCVNALGYSEPCAYRRIATVRISREVPEVKEKLDSGALSLTTVTMAQTLFRKENFSIPEKRKVLEKIENKSRLETEKILLSYTDTPDLFSPKEKFRMVTQTTTQMQLTVHNQVIAKLNRIRVLRSHKTTNMTYESLINDMCDFVLKKIDPNFKNMKKTQKDSKVSAARSMDSKATNTSKYLRYIPSPLRTEVWMRDGGQCTYTSQKTGHRCQAQHFLEIDHIQPIYAGGTATLNNLRLLCRGHNQMRNKDYL